MMSFMDIFKDYDYYKYTSQPPFHIENIINYYKAKEAVAKNNG